MHIQQERFQPQISKKLNNTIVSKRRNKLTSDWSSWNDSAMRKIQISVVLLKLKRCKNIEIFNFFDSGIWEISSPLSGPWCHLNRPCRVTLMEFDLQQDEICEHEFFELSCLIKKIREATRNPNLMRDPLWRDNEGEWTD